MGQPYKFQVISTIIAPFNYMNHLTSCELKFFKEYLDEDIWKYFVKREKTYFPFSIQTAILISCERKILNEL